MIIGRALGNLFDGMTITVNSVVITIKNNYGNQDALNKFIHESVNKSAPKFPLLFYVINPTKELGKFKYCDSNLIIMMNTEESFLYKERTDKTYITYIDPVYDAVVKKLKQSSFVTDLSEKIDRYSYTDVPNYGIINEETTKTTNPISKVQNNSAVSFYVDARIIKLRLKINTGCLIT